MLMVTMSDVAAAAGVSLTSVSHVLNRTRTVSARLRARIIEAAHELGYQDERLDDVGAAELTIGVVVPSPASPYLGELVEGIFEEGRRYDAASLLMTSGEDPWREYRAVQTLISRRVDGIIMAPTRDWGLRTGVVLRNSHLPCVLVDRLADPRLDGVGCEGAQAAQAIVSHVIRHGHSRVAMIRGLEGLPTTEARERGFRAALLKHRLLYDAALVVDGQSTIRGGQLATERLMAMPEPPTAIFAANNNMTVGMLHALRKLEVEVPRDLAVIAFDDLEWSDIVRPGITSIAQPFHAMGGRAFHLLAERLAEPERPVRQEMLPASLEYRESCGCPRLASLGG
ncbi:MAG: LacI family DNA-binding transcriptional regulator [Propioniciclava sp.]